MSSISRTYTFTNGTDADASQVESEVDNIVATWNNHNSGASKWSTVSALNSSATPLIADNGAGTNAIFEAKDNGTTVFSIANGGVVTASGGIKGTTTNDDAAAGNVGQYIRGAANSVNAANNTWVNIVSIQLTAGDWDISGVAMVTLATGTGIGAIFHAACSSGSAGTTTDQVLGDNYVLTVPVSGTATSSAAAIPSWRVSIASTTTYYVKGRIAFSGGQPTLDGRISARRVR